MQRFKGVEALVGEGVCVGANLPRIMYIKHDTIASETTLQNGHERLL